MSTQNAPDASAPLRPGDLVAVVSPSGPSDADALSRGIERLSQRYRVQCDARAYGRVGYLAGGDGSRAEALLSALQDPAVRAVFCARGGYGATRLLERHGAAIEQSVRAQPKPIIGFSDVTALHALWSRVGARSVHGAMPSLIGRGGAREDDVEALFAALEGDAPVMTGCETWVAEATRGVARGGNLCVLASLLGTRDFPPLDGAVLFLEDVTERPYRVDRMLTQLRASGALRGVRAFVLGDFAQCDPTSDGVTVEEVLRERLTDLGVAVFANAPFGHGSRHRPIAFGDVATLETDGTVRFSRS